jgi:hypothetical protein
VAMGGRSKGPQARSLTYAPASSQPMVLTGRSDVRCQRSSR